MTFKIYFIGIFFKKLFCIYSVKNGYFIYGSLFSRLICRLILFQKADSCCHFYGNNIFSCFVNSAEFNTVCETYGIVRGTYSSPHPSDYSLDVAGFAQRLYTNAMDRKPDIEGIDYWTKQMTTFAQSPLEVAKYFFYSKEFVGKNLSDEDFIRVLYLTCMNREPEEEGRQYWLNKLSEDENGRNSAIAFFLTCGEFRTIMADSGVAESNIDTVAKTQLGESGGLKYCNWYGYKYRIEWCACFVSWCANQCGYIDNNIALLSYDDVYYFEAVENHVYAYCKSDVYEVKYKLYELEENCRSMDFIRCSKSLIVNLSKIKYLSPMFNGRLEALLKNDEKVIISRQYVPELRRKLGI